MQSVQPIPTYIGPASGILNQFTTTIAFANHMKMHNSKVARTFSHPNDPIDHRMSQYNNMGTFWIDPFALFSLSRKTFTRGLKMSV